jgi:major facilitator 4 family protein
MWLITVGFILITFASQSIWVTFSPVVTNVAEELGVQKELVGYLAVLYPLFFLILTVPSGILLDRRFRFWLSFGAFMTFIGGFGRLLMQNYEWFFVCQLSAAIGQPFLLNGFVPFASKLHEKRRALIISILSLSMYLGTIFALATGYALYISGGIDLLILPTAMISTLGMATFGIGMFYFKETRSEGVSFSFARVTKKRDLWILGCILGLGVAAFDNLATWLQPALDTVGLGEIAGNAVAIAIVMGLLGILIIPNAFSKRSMRTIYIRTIIPLIAAFFGILAVRQDTIVIYSFLSISGFLMLPAYPIIMDWIGKFHEKDIHGSATGFVGLVSRAISVAMMFAAPLFIYSASAYFSFLTAIVVAALIFSLLLPNDRRLTA